MPVLPKIEVETPPWCNLRQALQWIRDEIRPVDPAFEAALNISAELFEDVVYDGYDGGDYRKAKSFLYATIRAKEIPLYGSV
jgi:hypothetical protein